MFGILLLAVMFLGLGLLALGVITVMSSDIKTNKSFIIAGLALFLIGCIGGSIVTTIDAGHVGIEKTFGAVSDSTYNPGLIIKSPWVEIIPFNVQQHESMQVISGGSKDELQYTGEIAFIYQVDKRYAPWIYREIGLEYENVAITSQMRDACRDVLGKYDAMYVYAAGKDVVKAALFERVEPEFERRHLILLDVNLRDYDPPQVVKDAAAEKQAVEQRYQTALNQKKIKEVDAEMMQIEAEAIAMYQKTVSEGISDHLIMWRGQEKLAEAAQHGNMIIVVTDGKTNIPMNMLVDGKSITS
jgi:regulator of protease activity HflC (stomatin/prohibitin superfamily)